MDEQIREENILNCGEILNIDTENTKPSSFIKVLGVGGAGTNAVNHMYDKGIKGVDLYVCNTDAQSLAQSPVPNKISIGKLGAGNNPSVAEKAAIENAEKINEVFGDITKMLFITAGMGGGTGTGASPVIAKLAKEVKREDNESILVVAVVTLPFSFEGKKRRDAASSGIEKLKEYVDAIIVINTDKLREYKNLGLSQAFLLADDILFTAVKGISEVITTAGYVQLDFRDVQDVMKNSGVALMGKGVASGENRALDAIKAATTSDLLNDSDIRKTKKILLNFSCSKSLEHEINMDEVSTITDYLEEITNSEVDYIWGITYDESLGESLSITLVATGFVQNEIYAPSMKTGSIEAPKIIKTEQTVNLEPVIQQPVMNETAEIKKIEVDTDGQPISKKENTGSPVTTSAHSSEQPVSNTNHTLSLDDILKERSEKISKIREMMNQPGGVEAIINMQPNEDNNFGNVFSYSSNTFKSNYELKQNGDIVVQSDNRFLDAEAD